MRACINETARRREKQMAYNQAHGIVPKTIVKSVRDLIEISTDTKPAVRRSDAPSSRIGSGELIASLEDKMHKAAKMLEYEIAAELRDEIIRLRARNEVKGK
ncbi:MAG: UvrB/UvrC motif-containing protein [Oscillospiraceae bacterium]